MRNNFPNSNFRLSIISLLAGRPRPCDQDPELDAGLSASVPTLLPPPERAAYPSAIPLPPESHDAGTAHAAHQAEQAARRQGRGAPRARGLPQPCHGELRAP